MQIRSRANTNYILPLFDGITDGSYELWICVMLHPRYENAIYSRRSSAAGKDFISQKEELRRKSTFEKNKRLVLEHNEAAADGIHSYNLTLNHLADVDKNRPHLARGLSGLLFSRHLPKELKHTLEAPEDEIPEELDWRERGFRTRSLDQADCGSCYAFTVAMALEAQVFKNNGTLSELSEQQLIDCSVLYGNLGCRGGSLRNTAKYLQRYHLLTRDKYPYKGKQSLCRWSSTLVDTNSIFSIHNLGLPFLSLIYDYRIYTLQYSCCRPQALYNKDGVSVKTWGVLPYGDEEALKKAVATVGPLAVSVNANPDTFQLYHSGVYDDRSCDANTLNHAMLVVGYTKHSWILQNWWTSSWGQGGFMHLKRGHNRCGVASYAVYLKIH
ncbi:Cat1 [Halyomorpha halys]|nr:Cat1 [Halyomorpha halys]